MVSLASLGRGTHVSPAASPTRTSLRSAAIWSATPSANRGSRGAAGTLVISIAIHVVVFASLLVYSLFQVDELWAPSVEVKVFSPAKLPPGVKDPRPASTSASPPNPSAR